MDQLRDPDDKEFSFGLDSLVDNEVTETAINDVMHTASAEGLSNPRDSDNLSELCHNMEEKEEDGNIAEKAVASTSPEGDVEISTIEDLNKHCNRMEEMEQQLVSQKELIMDLRNRVVSLEKTEEKALLFLQNVSSQRYIYRVKIPFYLKKRRQREEFLSTRAPKIDLRKRSEILAGQTDANAIEDPDEIPDIVSEQQNEVEDVTKKAVASTSPEADVEISTIEDLDKHCFQSDGKSSSRVIIDDDHEQEEEHSVVNDGILGFAKLFNDEIIFDNIIRSGF
ncbi:hypothetical protein Tco_1076582 [Tanacetum coccineum]